MESVALLTVTLPLYETLNALVTLPVTLPVPLLGAIAGKKT